MRRLTRAALRKLIALRPSDWVELVRAQVALLQARFLVRTRGRGRLVRPASEGSAGEPRSQATGPGDLDPGVWRTALAVERAADYGVFRANCLIRAVALQRLLEARGFPGSAVRVGARVERGHFTAHAWVEYAGHVLGDRDWHVQRFTPLAPIEVKQPS